LGSLNEDKNLGHAEMAGSCLWRPAVPVWAFSGEHASYPHAALALFVFGFWWGVNVKLARINELLHEVRQLVRYGPNLRDEQRGGGTSIMKSEARCRRRPIPGRE
jgi:hypothetical protein